MLMQQLADYAIKEQTAKLPAEVQFESLHGDEP